MQVGLCRSALNVPGGDVLLDRLGSGSARHAHNSYRLSRTDLLRKTTFIADSREGSVGWVVNRTSKKGVACTNKRSEGAVITWPGPSMCDPSGTLAKPQR